MADAHCTPQIYLITNMVNGKQYIGQTWLRLKTRWRAHCHHSGAHRMPVTRAIQKYGEDRFSIVAILTLPPTCSQAELDRAEQDAIAAFGSLVPKGYNLRTGGHGGKLHHETRAKMSAARRGRKLSATTIEKLRIINTGRTYSSAARARMSAAQLALNKHHTEEHKAAMSALMKGREFTPEWRAKLSYAKRHPSQETREKLRRANLGKKASEAARASLRAGSARRWARARRERIERAGGNPETQNVCSTCKQVKDLDLMTKGTNVCKSCAAARQRERNRRLKERQSA